MITKNFNIKTNFLKKIKTKNISSKTISRILIFKIKILKSESESSKFHKTTTM